MGSESQFENYIVSKEVSDALRQKMPVVAMETGYLAHRENTRDHIEDALKSVGQIREHGAVPAVVAIVDGILRVGLSDEELRDFLDRKDLTKCNMRDIAVVLGRHIYGTTTISVTIHAAARCGIRVVAAGGIGGVHRGFQESFDISPDLEMIAKYPIAIVCSGPKAILDIPFTMEYMETKGITVVGYNCSELPAYYVRESGILLEHVCTSPEEVAVILKNKEILEDKSGLLVVNPVRAESALDRQKMEQAVEHALEEAKKQKIKGKGITLFLLNEVESRIGSEVVDASYYIKLDNAGLAARIAAALAK